MPFEVLRWFHIASGAVALFALSFPLAARKGGPVHRRAGRIYVRAMNGVAATGLLLALVRIADPATREGGVFLLFVALLAATTTHHGVRALDLKARTGAAPAETWLPAFLVTAALGLLAWGRGDGLPTSFGALGLLIGGGQLGYWLRPPAGPKAWLVAHLGGMIGSGIGTVTAFLVVNAGRADLPIPAWVVWVGPTVVGVPLLAWWSRRVNPPQALMLPDTRSGEARV